MKTLLKTLFLAIALTSATSVSAQTPTDSTFLADMPESMQSDMDSLYWDWLSKMHLTVDDNCLVTPTSPVISDSLYIDRHGAPLFRFPQRLCTQHLPASFGHNSVFAIVRHHP